jgi:phytoene dehydrogenase-like protein
MKENKKIIIIGAGISGLACAYKLNKNGYKNIEVYEASPQAGGRCRAYFDETLQLEIDNGNHLILGCNNNVFEIINELNLADKFNCFNNKVFKFFNAKESYFYDFKAPFPSIKEFGFLAAFKMLGFILFKNNNKTVEQAFNKQSRFYNKFINPISRSILNTDSSEASANTLKNVFRKTIFSKNGFNAYFPKNNWDNALIKPLSEHLEKQGIKIFYNKSLKSVSFENDKTVKLNFVNEEIDCTNNIVVSAIPAVVTNKLFNLETPDEFESIINIHFKISHNISPQFVGIINSSVEWIFIKPNIISTTYSAANSLKLTDEELTKQAWGVIYEVFKLEVNQLPEFQIIKEKRATFKCTNQQIAKRPSNKTRYENLFLCGDYVENNFPSTIEGSILNGFNTFSF